MEKLKKIDVLREILKEFEDLTNDEIVEKSKGVLDSATVKTYLHRMKRRNEIEETQIDGKRHIKLNYTKRTSYKSDVLQTMLDIYLEDFENAELFSERAEIGKLILRILEKI